MPKRNQDDIQRVLAQYQVPYLDQDLQTSKVIKATEIDDTICRIDIVLGFPCAKLKANMAAEIIDLLKKKLPIDNVEVNITQKIVAHAVQHGLKGIPQVKNIIAIASGKGGVGKSTTAVNLALALQQQGASVGILDADIYGPNQPQMLGLTGQQPATTAEKKLTPLHAHGLQAMSIGFLIAQEDTPMIWRGPMVSGALQQLLNDTVWQDLDYLIIDLPPGTGDIQLTLSQKVPVTGAVIVTTPQDIALADARKAVKMFDKVSVPVLGVVENMSVYTCSQCGHQDHIFGEGGAKKMAAQYKLDYLGGLPLATSIREQADGGVPTIVAEPETNIAKSYIDIALAIAAKLSLQKQDYSAKFPEIIIENK